MTQEELWKENEQASQCAKGMRIVWQSK